MNFSYTAQRATFLTTVSTLGFLILVEGSVCVSLIILLIHNVLIQSFLLTAMVIFIGYFFARFFSLLLTHHQLTDTHLRLHYGFAFQAMIPRAAIVNAQATRERLTMFQPLQPEYQADKQRMVGCFSEQGQVLIQCNAPVQIKFGRTWHSVEMLLINVDNRDEFLRMLALSVEGSTAQAKRQAVIQQEEQRTITPLKGSQPVSPHLTSPAIEMRELTRRFGDVVVVDQLDMSIQVGEIYGFLGANGAGKTTTIKMLVGLLQPNAGQVLIAGHDMKKEPVAAKQAIGYVADRALLYERLSGREFLSFLSQMHGLPQQEAEQRIGYLLDMLELTPHADRLCGSYSFGMKRKLSLAAALLHQPRILILDEPLNGLDPRSSRALKDLLLALATSGVTILLSTHDVATAEAICSRVGILHKGRLLTEGSAADLRQLAQAPDLEAVFLNVTAEQQREVFV